MSVKTQDITIEVKPEESKRIEYSLEKVNALKNLILVAENNPLERNEILYKRFLDDFGDAQRAYDKEWEQIAKKYDIPEREGYQMHLNFNTYIIEYIPE